jgi:DNA/RNA endonuclease G (NUC1)
MLGLIRKIILNFGGARIAQRPSIPIEQCVTHLPWGHPTIKPGHVFIGREGYVLSNDLEYKIPSWVSYRLTPNHAVGMAERSNAFTADMSLPKGQRAEPEDYANTNFDKGHMACDADMRWDNTVERESFFMSNMSPQHGNLNRFVWKNLEVAVRAWTIKSNNDHIIYIGGIYDENDSTIGENKVLIPHAFYKIIINAATNEGIVFVMPHVLPYEYPSDFRGFQSNISIVESATAITFPVPNNINWLTPDKIWPVDVHVISEASKNL